jgi:hypothetical protein
MKNTSLATAAVALFALVLVPVVCRAQAVVETDFSKEDFESLGWKAQGAWSIYTYPPKQNNPGPVARYGANQPLDEPDGTLTKTFDEIKNPQKLELSIDAGWGWGGADHTDAGVAFMLLDDNDNGYVFLATRAKAGRAAQWSLVKNGRAPGQKNWAPEPIDARRASIMDGGGLEHLTVTRDDKGHWTFSSKDWNKGQGGRVEFTDTTTKSFTKLVLLGSQNYDELAFNHIVLVVDK